MNTKYSKRMEDCPHHFVREWKTVEVTHRAGCFQYRDSYFLEPLGGVSEASEFLANAQLTGWEVCTECSIKRKTLTISEKASLLRLETSFLDMILYVLGMETLSSYEISIRAALRWLENHEEWVDFDWVKIENFASETAVVITRKQLQYLMDNY